jgi:rhamnosyltransferase subunit B
MPSSLIFSAAYGSLGDVAPILAVVKEVLLAGKPEVESVTVIVNAYFQPHCAALVALGARVETLGSAPEYAAALADVAGRWNGPQDTIAMWLSGLEQHYALFVRLEEEAASRGCRATFVGHPLDVAVRILEEARSARAMTVVLQPWMLRSVGNQPSQYEYMPVFSCYPACIKAGVYKLQDLVVDSVFAAPINAFRAKLGLAPVARIYHTWFQCAGLLGLWPDWLASDAPAHDWPERLRLCGFAFPSDAADSAPERGADLSSPRGDISDELRAFIADAKAAGAPLCVITLGTSPPPYAARLFASAADACARIGARALLLCCVESLLPPAPLPAHVMACSFAPFDVVLQHAAVFVYNGGFGGFSQALRAGIAHVIIPGRFDQPHNAVTVTKMGVGVRLPVRALNPRRLAAALRSAMAPGVGVKCKAFAAMVAANDSASGARIAAEHIVAFAAAS